MIKKLLLIATEQEDGGNFSITKKTAMSGLL